MTSFPFIDAHVHANSRSGEDFERLAAVGCKALVAVAGAEGGFSSPDSVLDHFKRLARVDRPRIEKIGISVHLALGVHPAAIPGSGQDKLLAGLEKALDEHRAAAIGEIGLEKATQSEEEILGGQLGIARKLDLPVIVHTPRKEKRRISEKLLDILGRSGLQNRRILVDHVSRENLDPCLDSGAWIGLSVHPAKLTPQAACELLGSNDPSRFILSTDMGHNPSWLFGIPAAISAMQDRGFDDDVIRAVVHDNAVAFLGRAP